MLRASMRCRRSQKISTDQWKMDSAAAHNRDTRRGCCLENEITPAGVSNKLLSEHQRFTSLRMRGGSCPVRNVIPVCAGCGRRDQKILTQRTRPPYFTLSLCLSLNRGYISIHHGKNRPVCYSYRPTYICA